MNLSDSLNVYDMMVEYMMAKVKNGHVPSYTIGEFQEFLNYFEMNYDIASHTHVGYNLFMDFFDNMNKSIWLNRPHMDIDYDNSKKDYVISANYMFSDFDKSTINTYFMDEKVVYDIRSLIDMYLEDFPIRMIGYTTTPNKAEIDISKRVVATVVEDIWRSHIEDEIKYNKYPIQCQDIFKYFFDIDLDSVIENRSVKPELMFFYPELVRCLAVMYHDDNNLKLKSSGSYLSVSNYRLFSGSMDNLMDKTYGAYKKTFDVDMNDTSKYDTEHVKKLVKRIDSEIEEYGS